MFVRFSKALKKPFLSPQCCNFFLQFFLAHKTYHTGKPTSHLLQKILFLASPLTGGLSLTPSLPIAVAQIALAVHTTKKTGRMAAKIFLNSTNRKNGQPGLMLKYLIKKNTDLRMMIDDFNSHASFQNHEKNVLLP